MLDSATQAKVEGLLGHAFSNRSLLAQALTHSSMMEAGGEHNERLEFLGDAVLGLIVCDLLYRNYPALREGEMTKIKSHVVSRETCADIARRIGLDRHLILGKGMLNARSLPPSLAACALESIIAAIFIDGGYAAAERFVVPQVLPVIASAADSGHQRNFKSVLQQWAQQHHTGKAATPVYRVLDEQGPDHAKCFKISVEIAGRRFEPCWGATKKKAEQDAALTALRELGLVQGTGEELRVVGEVAK
jgi:ribonuclease-3